MTDPFKFLRGAMLDKIIANSSNIQCILVSCIPAFKHLFRPVVQYKDIQTRFVFLLRCVTFKPGNGNLNLSVLGQHSFVSFDQFRVDIEGYYIQFDYV